MKVFTARQLKRFSNIFDNAGQVFLGSLVINPLLGAPGNVGLVTITSIGAGLTFFLWWVSLRIERVCSNYG